MTRFTPASIHCAMLSMVRMPPPSWAGTSTAFRISSTAARLTGWPSTAPLRSTRCSHSQPALAKALAWAAGLSLNTVALRHVAAQQAHALAVLEVDGGKQDHGGADLARRPSLSSAGRPVALRTPGAAAVGRSTGWAASFESGRLGSVYSMTPRSRRVLSSPSISQATPPARPTWPARRRASRAFRRSPAGADAWRPGTPFRGAG